MPPRMATCHPNKQNFGAGLCCNCYYRKRYSENINGYREKKNATARLWRRKISADTHRKYKLKFRFGITPEQYQEMLDRQGGVCAACGKPPFPAHNGSEHLAVDHDHSCCPGERTCGKCIRGLIHSQCNSALGGAMDDPAVLRGLAAYIEKWKALKSAQTLTAQ